MSNKQETMTTRQAAQVLDLHICTVSNMCQGGALPAEKRGNAWHIDAGAVRELKRQRETGEIQKPPAGTLTVKQAAAELSLSPSHVQRLLRTEQLKGERVMVNGRWIWTTTAGAIAAYQKLTQPAGPVHAWGRREARAEPTFVPRPPWDWSAGIEAHKEKVLLAIRLKGGK